MPEENRWPVQLEITLDEADFVALIQGRWVIKGHYPQIRIILADIGYAHLFEALIESWQQHPSGRAEDIHGPEDCPTWWGGGIGELEPQ